jgi:small conductance mechanosensitive channel
MDISIDEYEKYWEMLIQYGTDYGLKIIGAILIFLIGKWVARRLTNVTQKVMQKAEVDPTLLRFAENLVYMLLMVVVVLAALNTLGVQTTSFVAILGAAGLAIGLALQGTLGNVGSGVLLVMFRPFQVGDFVNAGGEAGSVEAISLFATTLKTPDNKVIIIPNSAVTGGNITNFSAKETRRVDLIFGIGYGDDLKAAKNILREIIDSDKRVLREPEPFLAVSELAESSVNFVMRLWVKREDYWDVHFDTIEKVKLTFDEKGISIPYPQMDVHLDKPEQKENM